MIHIAVFLVLYLYLTLFFLPQCSFETVIQWILHTQLILASEMITDIASEMITDKVQVKA